MGDTASGLAVFACINGMAVYISFTLGRILFTSCSASCRALVTTAGYGFVVYLVIAATGIAGILSPLGVSIFLLVLTFAVTLLAWMKGKSAHRLEIRRSSILRDDELKKVIFGFSLILFSGFAAEWLVKSLALGTYFGPDDLVYHAGVSARWIVDGRISVVPYSYQAYYPFNAELLSIWYMLPFRTDAFASLTSLYWGSMAVCALYVMYRSLNFSRVSFFLVAALFLGSTGVQGSSVQRILQSFAANDLAGPALLLGAFALLFSTAESPRRERNVAGLYCGLMVGFAVGTKISFAPAVLIIGIWLLLSRTGAFTLKQRTANTVLFLCGVILTGGLWYVRNLFITGNPLFPAEIGPFAGPLGAAERGGTTLIRWIMQPANRLGNWLAIGRGIADWPIMPGVLSFFGYAASSVFLIRRLRRGTRGGILSSPLALLFGSGIALFLVFLFLPFSATINRPDAGLSVANRYMIFSYAVGLVLFGRVLQGTGRASTVFQAVSLLTLFSMIVLEKKMLVIGACAVTAGLIYLKALRILLNKITVYRHIGPVTLVIFFAGLMIWYPWKRELTDRSYYSPANPSAVVFRELENVPPLSPVGYFGNLPFSYTPFYRLFGRRLQLRPVPLQRDGRVSGPLHARASDWTGGWWQEWSEIDRTIESRTFAEHLHASGVRYVITTKFPAGDWPLQHKLFETVQDASQIYNDGYSALWKLGD